MQRARNVNPVLTHSPRLSDDERAITAVEFSSNLQDSIVAAIDGSADRSVAVIPEGPYVVPFYQPVTASRPG